MIDYIVYLLVIFVIADTALILQYYVKDRKRYERLEEELYEEVKAGKVNKLFEEEQHTFLSKKQILLFGDKLRENLITKYKLPRSVTYSEISDYLRNIPMNIKLKTALVDFFDNMTRVKYGSDQSNQQSLDKMREAANYITSAMRQSAKTEEQSQQGTVANKK